MGESKDFKFMIRGKEYKGWGNEVELDLKVKDSDTPKRIEKLNEIGSISIKPVKFNKLPKRMQDLIMQETIREFIRRHG